MQASTVWPGAFARYVAEGKSKREAAILASFSKKPLHRRARACQSELKSVNASTIRQTRLF
jgi:high-affinity K+ transport system ATPase subunit B